MKVIRIFNAQPVEIPQIALRAYCRVKKHGDPIFLLHFFNVQIMDVDYAMFQKSLIVEQFKGNYLKVAP